MGKMEKLTNSIKNQTGKEVKGMKKVLISLALAMVLVVALTVPVMAATETASVTVNEYISLTLLDIGTDGVNFGSLDAGTSDNDESDQTTSSSTFDSGSCTSAGTATSLTDSAATFMATGVKRGMIAYNVTDDSTAYVDSDPVSETGLTTTALTGGTANVWGNLDAYTIYSGALVYAIESETNATVYCSVKADNANFSDGGSETFASTNASFDTDDNVTGGSDMDETYEQVGSAISDTSADQYQPLWHWITIPGGQAQGVAAYTCPFSYQITTSDPADPD